MAVKGIIIEIEGKTSGLVKSLGDVNKSLRETQSNLRTVEKALKLDPTNVDALKTKQTLLTTAIDQTREKLEIEKQAATDAAKALEEGTITRTQYDALQAEVAATSAELTKLENSAKETEQAINSLNNSNVDNLAKSVDNAGKKIQEIGSKVKAVGQGIKDLGKDMTTGVTVPIVAAGKASLDAFSEVDGALDTVIKKTGATGEVAEAYGEIVKGIATEIPTSFETVANAVGEVNTRFGLTGDNLKEVSEQFVKFSELNDTEVSASIDKVQSAMASYGVSASEVGTVLNILTKAGQDTGVSVDQLASDLTANGTALKEMGFNLNTSIGFLANLNKNGVDSSAVMTGLRRALANATAEGKTMDEALAELNKSMSMAQTDTEAMNLAVDLFGTKAGPAMAQAIREGRLSFDELSNSVQNYSGAVDTTFSETLDPIDEMTTTINELKLAMSELGATIGTTLQPILQTLAEQVRQLAEWWRGLSPEVQENIVKVAMLVATIGPLLVVIGSVVSAIGTAISAGGAVVSFIGTTLIPAIGTMIGAIGLPVVAAIGLVIAAVIQVIRHWDEMKLAAQMVGEEVRSAFETLKENIIATFTAIGAWISNTWETIKAITVSTFEMIGAVVSEKISSVRETIVSGISSAVDFLRGLPSQALEWGRDLIQNFIDGALSKFNSLRDTIINAAQTVRSYLHFSVPDKGPLSDADEYGGDFIDLFREGILKQLPQLESTLNTSAGALKSQVIDYSTQLGSINASVDKLAGSGGNIVIPVYLGGQRIDEVVVNANQRNNFRSGGR